MISAALSEAADLARVSKIYRISLQVRALERTWRGHHEMASFLAAGADVAGELAARYAEAAMFLAAVKSEELT